MKLQGKLEGVNEFQSLLDNLPGRVQRNVLQRAATTAMRYARPAIKKAAPVDKDDRSPLSQKHGRLRTNIRVARVRQRKKTERGAILNTGMAPWGYWLEKGTRYIAAQPWFLPAWTAIQGLVIKTFSTELGKGIDQETRKLMKGKGR